MLHDTTASSSSSDSLRDDLTEIETIAMSCILRFILRYVMELENLDHTLFTLTQLRCFRETIQAIMFHMLSSMQQLFEEYFYVERIQLLPTHPTVSTFIIPCIICI